jgi:hypothetical protein
VVKKWAELWIKMEGAKITGALEKKLWIQWKKEHVLWGVGECHQFRRRLAKRPGEKSGLAEGFRYF